MIRSLSWIALGGLALVLAGCASPEELDARLDKRDGRIDNVVDRLEVRGDHVDARQERVWDAIMD